jgi:hypothetical protein
MENFMAWMDSERSGKALGYRRLLWMDREDFKMHSVGVRIRINFKIPYYTRLSPPAIKYREEQAHVHMSVNIHI